MMQLEKKGLWQLGDVLEMLGMQYVSTLPADICIAYAQHDNKDVN